MAELEPSTPEAPTTVTHWDLGGEKTEVVLRRSKRPEESHDRFPALEPGRVIEDGILIDRDVAVPLRDGTVIYVDVYRPDDLALVPAIIAWSPYGKRVGYVGMNDVRGVPATIYSPRTKTEGPDPEYWCRRGYAVVNPDPRGAGNSEGVIQFWSSQEGRDAADLVEWLAVQQWCSGKVGMAGNSWLAMSQWFTAAEQPPHLACIAPWEGIADPYRELSMRGGIQETAFMGLLMSFFHGQSWAEDIVATSRLHPLLDAYWSDKIPAVERISVPVYATGSWSHFHLQGSLHAFRQLTSEDKWIRLHRDFEWPDQYDPQNLADLGLFFERYLKGRYNGWELTPRVRLDVMDRGDQDHIVRRAEKAFPLPGTMHVALALDAETSTLSRIPPTSEKELSYDALTGRATFDMVFEEDTELTGYSKLRLWIEARGNDDLDLFVAVTKADEAGAEIPTFVMDQPYPGASGLLRASHRQLDESRSTPSEPVQTHAVSQPVSAGEIVPVDIAIWPFSRFWHAGESLRVIVSGHSLRGEWFEPFGWDTKNAGTHVIHTGGRFDSHLLVPVIPARRPVVPGPLLRSS